MRSLEWVAVFYGPYGNIGMTECLTTNVTLSTVLLNKLSYVSIMIYHYSPRKNKTIIFCDLL